MNTFTRAKNIYAAHMCCVHISLFQPGTGSNIVANTEINILEFPNTHQQFAVIKCITTFQCKRYKTREWCAFWEWSRDKEISV